MKHIPLYLLIIIHSSFFSCGGNENASSVATVVTEQPAPTDSEKKTEAAPANHEPSLPIIQLPSSRERFIDWGSKPEDPIEGPGDPWVMPHWHCEGIDESNTKVSSTLAPQGKFNYKLANLGDDDPTTAWVEGNPDYGVGAYIEFTNRSINSNSIIYILNGYQSSASSWENNSRVKQFKVSVNGKDEFILELADNMGTQEFKFPKNLQNLFEKTTGKEHKIRFTILDVYPGLKWKDTAISELFICMDSFN